MFRRLRIAVAIAPILAALTYPLPAYADTAVAVDCGDGAPINATVDLATLTKLQASIQSMIDNPAGVTCGLSTDNLVSIGGGSGDPFVVGGGRYARGSTFDFGPGVSDACGINFSLNAHQDSTGFHGQQSYTIPNVDGCSQYAGHIHANVTCLAVSGNHAEIRGDITDATGFFTGIQQSGLSVFVSDVTDNGPPSSVVRDTAYLYNDADGSETACHAPGVYSYFERPMDNGNITVHD
jgi:hypothetical protein